MSVTIAYVVTRTTIFDDKKVIFLPCSDVEVFLCYFSALRYLAKEKNYMKMMGGKIRVCFPRNLNRNGREQLGVIEHSLGGMINRYILSRVIIKNQ